MPRRGRAYALDEGLLTKLVAMLRESGGMYNRGQLRKRTKYSFGSTGGTAGFGYAVIRSIDPDFPWTVTASVATPVDRAAGEWSIAEETVDMFTDNVDSRYYRPFIWNGQPTSFHAKFLLKTRIEPDGIIIQQGIRLPYLATQPANPPSQCQILGG